MKFPISRLIAEQFSTDLYLVGLLNFQEHIFPRLLKYTKNKSVQQLSVPAKINSEQAKKCSECTTEWTNQMCAQCNVTYCAKCFKDCHKTGKALRKHTLCSIMRIDQEIEMPICTIHLNMDLNYFCTDCKVAICQLCKIEAHANHTNSTIILEVIVKFIYFCFY